MNDQATRSAAVGPSSSESILRRATADDVEAITTVWYRGWFDGHLGHVPPGLRRHRRLDDFRRRVPDRIEGTTVATIDGYVVGFVTVRDDEVEQLYVAESARGGAVASALMRHAEEVIAARFDSGWLAVVAGNARARRFYARRGWLDSGPIDYPAETASGTFAVPSRRYEKHLA